MENSINIPKYKNRDISSGFPYLDSIYNYDISWTSLSVYRVVALCVQEMYKVRTLSITSCPVLNKQWFCCKPKMVEISSPLRQSKNPTIHIGLLCYFHHAQFGSHGAKMAVLDPGVCILSMKQMKVRSCNGFVFCHQEHKNFLGNSCL